jgi:hypothetical protein
MTLKEVFGTSNAGRELMLACSAAVVSAITSRGHSSQFDSTLSCQILKGNAIAFYYVGQMLDNAGITELTSS